jgi:general secretion pathway protein E
VTQNKGGARTGEVVSRPLGQLFLEQGLVTAEQLEAALELQQTKGGRLGEILIEQGLITPEDVIAAYSVQLNLPLIDLNRHIIQPEAMSLVSEETARKYNLIPLDLIGDSLVIVMANPEDIRAIEDIRAQVKMRVEITLAPPAEIEDAINRHYKSGGEIEKHVHEFAQTPEQGDEASADVTATTPIAHSLDLLIQQAVRDRASDVHLEPQKTRLRVRYRIDGILHDVLSLPLSAHTPLLSRIKILADMNIAEQRRPQDGQFAVTVGRREVDIRAASMLTAYGERITLRILDKSASLRNLNDLGFLPDTLDKFRHSLKNPFGMILVGGPTGSGKTTTLYSAIAEMDRNELNIVTVEDPIEYRFVDISQTQVNPKAGITYASGLRAIVRHDPDVVLVGEIRDKETASIAVQAALTGHLVLASIHANDAVSVLFRLLDFDVEPYLVATTLVAVLAQRMVRRVCRHCAALVEPSADEMEAFIKEIGQPLSSVSHGEGCMLCANTGYYGRTGLFELMIMNEDIRRMLLTDVSSDDMRVGAAKQGMVTMKHDGMMKVREGITSVSEVIKSVFSLS